MEIQRSDPAKAGRQSFPSCKDFRGREGQRDSSIRLGDSSLLWSRLRGKKDANELYNATLSMVCQVEITSGDVEKFCLDLKGFQNEEDFPWRAGLMLSALINASVESEFRIPAWIFEKRLSMLGFRNRKNISVDGEVGDGFAKEMEEGIATVSGEVYGNFAPGISGGIAIAEKNVYGRVGSEMTGGEVNVLGDVGDIDYIHIFNRGMPDQRIFVGNPMFTVGLGMSGGKIDIEGFSGALTGLYQKDGLISVGYAGSLVGPRRSGGQICIARDYESLSRNPGEGRIMIGEKQLHPKKKNGEDKALAQLMDFWDVLRFDSFDIQGSYQEAFDLSHALIYSGDDVANFSRALGCMRRETGFLTKAGIALSALINGGEGLFYNVDLAGLGGIGKLGFRNSKIIRAIGNPGPHAGAESLAGSIMIVEGDIGYAAGAWGSGSLLVTGDAEDFLALGKKDGYIEVLGSAGAHVGQLLDGGRVCVRGMIGSLGKVCKGLVERDEEVVAGEQSI